MIYDKMTYDPNNHKAKILFQDLPQNKNYQIKVPSLYTQLKEKYSGHSQDFSKKEYHRHCILLEDCSFNESITLLDKPITIKTGHRVDISFPPSFFTKFSECIDADNLQPDSIGQITFYISDKKAQRGSRKWIITQIKRIE